MTSIDFQTPLTSVRSFVDGAPVKSWSDRSFGAVNPSTAEELYDVPEGDEQDVDRAVISSRAAFEREEWKDEPALRARLLYRWADLIELNAHELDRLDALEMGKPVSVDFCNALKAAEFVRFYAGAIDKVAGDVFPSEAKTLVIQRRVPRGVVAAVVPWNFPTFCSVMKLAPALAAGNAVVLKPSELSPSSAFRLAEMAIDAGIPPGLVNVVMGRGSVVGRALGLHMDVDMLTFTGSTSVGKLMLQYAGQSNMKVVLAECGGKSPQLVFNDGVDLDEAANSIAGFLLVNQGQICSVGSRILVERSIQKILVDKIADRMQRIVTGNALDPAVTFGPLASAEQKARVERYIEVGRGEGRLALGGQQIRSSQIGHFVQPTLFYDVDPRARIAQEEIFGPVLSVIPFDSVEEAVRIANGTVYGLASFVWTANLSTGLRVAKQLRASVFVSSTTSTGQGAGFAASHEPFGQSGIGCEVGVAGMESYMARQLISFTHA